MAEITHDVDSRFEWGVRPDVSHRGVEPLVCYEILLAAIAKAEGSASGEVQ